MSHFFRLAAVAFVLKLAATPNPEPLAVARDLETTLVLSVAARELGRRD